MLRITHGHTLGYGAGVPVTRTYRSWMHILQRCTNPKSHVYRFYGGRGIKVCARWRRFENFLADMGTRGPGMTIERIDNAGHYEPGNCRWATQKEQGFNRRSNRLITFYGETKTLTQWAEGLGIDAATLAYRVKHWPLVTALTTPRRARRDKKIKPGNNTRRL